MAKRERAAGEAPKRKRGRPKGSVKTGGRVKKTPAQLLYARKEQARDSIWDYVIRGLTGQPVKSRGPTGKQISQPLSEDNQVKLLQTAWRKLEPDLNATAIRADVTTETVNRDPPEPRQLARVVLSILESAKLADEPVAEPAAPPAPPAQLLLGRDDVIEIQAHQVDASTGVLSPRASGPTGRLPLPEGLGGEPDAASPHHGNGSSLSSLQGGAPDVSISGASGVSPNKPKHGEKILFNENGAEIVFDAPREKWAVFDVHGMQHGWRRSKEEATAFAESLPKPSLKTHVRTDQPPEPMRPDYAAPDGRPDQRPLRPKAPNVIRRAPR